MTDITFTDNHIFIGNINIGDIIDDKRIYIEHSGSNWYIRDIQTKGVLIVISDKIYSHIQSQY